MSVGEFPGESKPRSATGGALLPPPGAFVGVDTGVATGAFVGESVGSAVGVEIGVDTGVDTGVCVGAAVEPDAPPAGKLFSKSIVTTGVTGAGVLPLTGVLVDCDGDCDGAAVGDAVRAESLPPVVVIPGC